MLLVCRKVSACRILGNPITKAGEELLSASGNLALQGNPSYVSCLVPQAAGFVAEALPAFATQIGSLSRVDPLVSHEVSAPEKTFLAVHAAVRPWCSAAPEKDRVSSEALYDFERCLFEVLPLVPSQVGADVESFPAQGALVRLLSRVNPVVANQSRLEVEAFPALGAAVGLLSRVAPPVVNEV